MKKNKIFESFNATRGIKEDEDIDLVFTPDEEATQDEEEVLDVVDGELETGENGENKSYVGRYVAICPVCAEPFFCNEEATIIEGMAHDVCPVCQEEIDAQVIGIVSPLEEEEEEEAQDDEIPEDGEPKSEDEDEVPESEDEDEVPEEDPVDESVNNEPKTPEDNKATCEKCGKTSCECKDDAKFSLEFDESAMNTLLQAFIEENYPKFKSIKVERVVRKNSQLVVEAVATSCSGKSRAFNFIAEDFKLGRHMKMEMSCEELNAPAKSICIEARLKSGAIIPESMSYDYVTKVLSEGKMRKAQIVGSHKA